MMWHHTFSTAGARADCDEGRHEQYPALTTRAFILSACEQSTGSVQSDPSTPAVSESASLRAICGFVLSLCLCGSTPAAASIPARRRPLARLVPTFPHSHRLFSPRL